MAIEQTRVKLERVSLAVGGGAFVVGALVALTVLRGHTPLFGRGSIGDLAAFTAAPIAALSCLLVLGVLGDDVLPWHRNLSRFRRIVDLIGLMLLFGSLALLLVMALYQLFSSAFRTIQFDHWSGSFLVAATCAMVGYLVASATSRLTTSNLSMLLGLFIFAGAIFAGITSANEYWWRMHFSTLGTAVDASGIAFNFTLILSGLVLITLSEFIVYDIYRMVRFDRGSKIKVGIARFGFILLGACLGLIGVLPESLTHRGHLIVTYGAIAVVAVMMLVMIVVFPRVARTFWAPTLIIAAMLAVAGYLFRVVRYLNTTAFEMIAVMLVLAWLFLLIRTIASIVEDLPHEDAQRWEQEIEAPERDAEPSPVLPGAEPTDPVEAEEDADQVAIDR